MINLQILKLLPIFAITQAAYPYYNTDKYNYGGNVRRSAVQWSPYRPVLRAQRSPTDFYTTYPYSASYLEDYYRYYYPQETYPIYYPRTNKYNVYHQAAIPNYYYRRPTTISDDDYDNYYYDPSELQQDELLQEVEREEREDSQPIGHELLYENQDFNNNLNSYDKASMAYFQKLLQQKNQDYNKQFKEPSYSDYSDYYESEWQDIPATKLPPYHSREDKEVQDLRKLKNKSKAARNLERESPYYKRHHGDQKRSSKDEEVNSITSSVPKTQMKKTQIMAIEEKRNVAKTTTTQVVPLEPKKEVRGQKEEVMMRPATPVRHPFNAPWLNLIANDEERKRSPSVFDTLKRMLEMEKNLKNKYGEENLRPAMKKRIVSDEDSLIRQLTVLKKSK